MFRLLGPDAVRWAVAGSLIFLRAALVSYGRCPLSMALPALCLPGSNPSQVLDTLAFEDHALASDPLRG